MTQDRPTATSRRPEGWYASPDADGMQRWWDGTRWTAALQVAPQPVVMDRAEVTGRRRRKVAGVLVAVLGACVAAFSMESVMVDVHERPVEPGRAIVEARMVADDAPGRCSTTATLSVDGQRYLVTEPTEATASLVCDHVGDRVPVNYSTTDPGDGTAEIQHPGLYFHLDNATGAGIVGGLLLVAAGTSVVLRAGERRRR